MAEQSVILCIGSSNMAGFDANLYEVPIGEFARWTSTATPTGSPTFTPTRPYELRISGVRMWTPRRPYSLNSQRAISGVNNPTTITHGGAAISAPTPTADQWMYILRGTGRGNLRRIFTYPGGGNQIAVYVDFSPTPVVGDTVVVLQDSHTIASVSADGLVVNKTPLSPALTAADVGRYAIFHDSFSGTETTRKITAQTATSVTFDQPLTIFPTVASPQTVTFNGATERVVLASHGFAVGQAVVFEGGTPPVEILISPRTVYYVTNIAAGDFQLATTIDNAFAGTNFAFTGNGTGTTTLKKITPGFQVLAGANACHGISTMQPPNAVLQDLTFALDEVSPCYLTGVDYPNHDFTPFASPRALSADPTINSIPELAWQIRARTNHPIVIVEIGVSASKVSPFPISVLTTSTLVGPLHDITHLDFHPSSPLGIHKIVAEAIASVKALIEAENNTAKFEATFINLADNDGTPVQYERIGENMVLLRDSIRTLTGNKRMRWIMSGPSTYGSIHGLGGTDLRPAIYEQLFQIEFEDEHSAAIDTRIGYGKSPDGFHLSQAGQIKLGQDFYALGYAKLDDQENHAAFESDVAICNLALSHVGANGKITALDGTDTSAEAKHCIKFYGPALKQLLEMHSWDFATRRTELVAVTNTRTEWRFAYEAPRKMAGAIAVLPRTAPRDAPTQLFLKEVDVTGKTIIYTDVENAVIRYNRYVTNPHKMTASFGRCLSLLIGADLAGVIIKGDVGRKVAAELIRMMAQFLGPATTHDSNQRKVEPETEAPWMQ